MKLSYIGYFVAVIIAGICSFALVGMIEFTQDEDDVTGGTLGGGTTDYIDHKIWFDSEDGANWTLYTSSNNPNMSYELPNNDFAVAEVYYTLENPPEIYVGLYNDVNYADINETIVDNMRTLTYAYETPEIMESKHDDILSWNLELLYKEDSLNTTPNEIQVSNITIGEAGIQTVYLRIYHYDEPNNRGMEARYFYSFFEPAGTNYEIFLAYSIIKNLSEDPTQFSETMAREEAIDVFGSVTI